MSFIETIKARARSDVKTIVLPESEDDRTILAAAKVLAEGTAAPIIIGTEEEVMGSAARLGADLTGVRSSTIQNLPISTNMQHCLQRSGQRKA